MTPRFTEISLAALPLFALALACSGESDTTPANGGGLSTGDGDAGVGEGRPGGGESPGTGDGNESFPTRDGDGDGIMPPDGGPLGGDGDGGSPAAGDPNCSRGVMNGAGSICCPASCGTCGGEGCAMRDGGENCCAGPVIETGVSCADSEAPCILGVGGDGDGDGDVGDGDGDGGDGDGTTPPDPDSLYTLTGTDPNWSTVLESGNLTIGENSTTGYLGSDVTVNRDLVEQGPYAGRPIPQGIMIHTVGHSVIRRNDFPKWSRWYQEDGNTQIFRLFDGEHNVRNDRGNAARVEAHGGVVFDSDGSAWHEWSGRYTIISAGSGGSIFQSKDNVEHWSVMINLKSNGDIVLNRREGNDETLAPNMIGKSFDLRIRDNGHDYEVFFNGAAVGGGSFQRSGRTTFRWGFYVGDTEVEGDMMMFVTGVEMN